MNRPSKRLKLVAEELSVLFSTDEGSRALNLMTRLSQREPATPPASAPTHASNQLDADGSSSMRVGIWEPRQMNGEKVFVRVQTEDAWTLWANVGRINPKRNRKRVVLIGESAARGFFYDPAFNPAIALQNILRQATSSDSVEVVDLARVDLRLAGLRQLTQASLALEPDVLLIMAGNNWHPISTFEAEQLEEIAEILRAGGDWRAVKVYVEEFVRDQVSEALRMLGHIVETQNIPIVFLLPEFNLADWSDECHSPPMLSRSATAQWLETRETAERHLSLGELEKAEALARDLMAIDGGTTPVGARLIADVKLRQGNLVQAREHLEMARDAGICWPRHESPRCYSVIQQIIRDQAQSYGIHLIDLPRRLEEYLCGEIPGQRLFLDYCHLNVEGIKVAMAFAAETLLPLLDQPGYGWDDLSKIDLPISRQLEGEAQFLAAVHNGNWGQGSEIIRHFCREALRFYPEVAEMMKLFLDFHIRRAPSPLCKSFDEMYQLKTEAAMGLLFIPVAAFDEDFLNDRLVTEMTDILENAGIKVRERIDGLIRKEHSVGRRGVNLLEKDYSRTTFGGMLNESKYGFYQSDSDRSRFRLVCHCPMPVRFILTHRVPGAKADQAVEVFVNGTRIYQVPAGESWASTRFTAPAEVIRSGMNSIEIGWPLPEWSDAEWRDQAARRLEAGELPEIVPVFGEIHSFQALPVE